MRGQAITTRIGRGWIALAAILALSNFVSGCALLGIGPKTASDASQLESNATSIAFGNVSFGTTAHQTLLLTNPGTSTITISKGSTTSSAFSISSLRVPTTLAGGSQLSVTIAFTPANMGTASGDLNLTSNAANTSLTIPMTAIVVAPAPQITLNPAGAAFGNVNVGSSSSQTVTISNPGSATLTISAAGTNGPPYTMSGLTLPTNVSAGGSTTFSVQFTPTTAGTVSGYIAMTTNVSATQTIVGLSGTGVTASTAQLSLNPTDAHFGNVNVGSSSTLPILVSNPGTATLTISQIAVSGAGFSDSGLNTPVTVGAGSSTTLNVKFAPTTTGAVSGTVTLTSNASSSPNTLPLTGTGIAPQISLNPSPVAFGNVTDGTNSSKTVTISNPGTATLTISSAAISGTGFTMSGLTTPLNIAAGGNSTFNVTFAATGTSAVSGNVTLTSNAAGSPTALSLTATGVATPTPLISLAPSSVAFGNVPDGTTKSQTITVQNTGNATLTISAATPTGTGYSISGLTLPLNIAAGASSTFNVNFAPTGTTAVSGSVSIVSNVATSPTALPLTGTGVAAPAPLISLTPSSVAFGNVVDGTTNSQTITVQNTGNATLTISAATPTGTGYSVSGLALPLNIAAGASSTFNVNFAPTGTTAVSGSVSIVSNVATSPTALPLTGTGVAATVVLGVSSNSVSFGNVTDGTTGTQTVTLTNNGNANLAISGVSVTAGLGFGISGVTPPETLTPGQKVTLTVTFVPSGTTAASGTVTITSNATTSPASISVSGTGVAAVQHSVTLGWTASTSTVSGYNIYRSTTSGTGYVKINTSLVSGLSYTDSTVAASTVYYYVGTAVDSSGNESTYSNQATATIP
jgi:hypothetical protein